LTPTQKLVHITAWSYSRHSTYEQCPAKAKYSIIDKLKEPGSAAMDKGNLVHAVAAVWATDRLPVRDRDNDRFYGELQATKTSKVTPTPLILFTEEFAALRKRKGVMVEDQWTFDRQWNDMGPQGWFSPMAWLRIKVDLHYLAVAGRKTAQKTTVVIRDHKTGKWSPDHALQRSLYALGALLRYPDAAEVEVSHWYLDLGRAEPPEGAVWSRAQLPALKEEWTRRTAALLADTTFAPNPTDKCRWCHFRKANGGPCSF
jgi:hypothetical protein